MEEKMNLERVIVSFVDDKPMIYGFLKEGETDDEAKSRAFLRSMENLQLYSSNHNKYPWYQEDGSEYWQKQYDIEAKREYKVMSYDQFIRMERVHILSLPLQEISEEEYYEMLNVLPPLEWITRQEVEMFCMSEFYTGVYTTQYAYDKVNKKFYSKIVDYTDKSTWICELLR